MSARAAADARAAPDRARPGGWPVPAGHLAALGAAAGDVLARYAAGRAPEAAAVDAVARLARAARRDGVGLGGVLAAVQGTWYALPAVRATLGLAAARERLSRLVAAGVRAYDRDDRA